MVDYRPFAEREPDSQYRDLLWKIHLDGKYTPTRQGSPAKTVLGQTMTFDLANGFPMIGDRNLGSFWRTAINELGAFINGAHTLEALEAAGVNWWTQWGTEKKTSKRGLAPGDLGHIYGYAWTQQLDANGQPFDMWQALVEQIKLYPYDRRHHINPWIAQDVMRTAANPDSNVTIAPCHGWIDVTILDDGLHLEMMQRSGDFPVGVPSNMIQYAALTLYLAHITGQKAVEYIHHIRNAHIYQNQMSLVAPMLYRTPVRFPTVVLNEKGLAATDIREFSGDLFDLTDYHPHPSIPKIPVLT